MHVFCLYFERDKCNIDDLWGNRSDNETTTKTPAIVAAAIASTFPAFLIRNLQNEISTLLVRKKQSRYATRSANEEVPGEPIPGPSLFFSAAISGVPGGGLRSRVLLILRSPR